MPHVSKKLTTAFVKTAPTGKHSDGDGLWLYKRRDGGAQWVLRYTLFSRRHEMGLGRFPSVSLKEAREEADKWRAVVRQDIDAIKERERHRREAERNLHILSDIARDAFESRKADLKGEGKAGRWFSPLELYILPKLGKMPVSEIDQRDIRDTLAPIWHTKPDTARKGLNRLGICMRHAAALGLNVDLQATMKAKELLGAQRQERKNYCAMKWQDVPAFYQTLNGGSITELALQFLILTGMRSKPIRFAHIDQIEGDIWTVPADLLKGRVNKTTDFRVPLSYEAQRVIEQARPMARDGFIFSGVRKGVISDATLSKFMTRQGYPERPHGFRSSLRDWLAEATNAPHEVAETCLGHVTGSTVERAYRRTDYLDQRRALMERWGQMTSQGINQVSRIANL
ncbi:integrase arm-type DNA-binding domain-containing protein [Rhodobacteraceae bacterium LMO-12]|nr:integrase arm-type DNA-binding domain-containing protein [Rhodobacteraceae bacterium LMO-JJ12]